MSKISKLLSIAEAKVTADASENVEWRGVSVPVLLGEITSYDESKFSADPFPNGAMKFVLLGQYVTDPSDPPQKDEVLKLGNRYYRVYEVGYDALLDAYSIYCSDDYMDDGE